MFETGLTLHPAQRELKNLYDLGIIQKRETLNKVYYEIDPHSLFINLCARSANPPKNKLDPRKNPSDLRDC